MKLSLLALLSMIFVAEAFAQRYNPRPGRGNGGTYRTNPSRPGRVIVTDNGYDNRYDNRNDGRGGRVILRDRVVVRSSGYRWVGPRYNPPGRMARSYRTEVRPWQWQPSNSLSCDNWSNTLNMNGYRIHDFMFNSDCQQAIYDIQNYGDFCDNADLFDQSGALEAQFSFEYECRNALGWYY